MAWEGGKPVVTFPIPGVPGATATATLDAKYMAERVVVKNGSTTTEFTYGNYKDWNNPLNKVEVLYAGKMTERRNGAVVRDLTTKETETGSVYVVMPVPASVQKAITVTVPAPPARPLPAAPTFGPPAPPRQSAQEQPTPRRADGQPDLTGNWRAAAFSTGATAIRRCGPTQSADCYADHQSDDGLRVRGALAVRAESSGLQTRALGQGSAARHVDEQGRSGDDVPAARAFRGTARRGASSRRTSDVIFLYGAGVDGGGGYGEYRVVPTDGRKHDPKKALETTFYGVYRRATGRATRWCSTRSRSYDTTWLARGGFFHSDQMHVVEKFTRKGNRDSVRSDRRGSRGARGAVGDDAAKHAAQPESRRGAHAGARQLRGLRGGRRQLSDSPLTDRIEVRETAKCQSRNLCGVGAVFSRPERFIAYVRS